MQLMANGRGFEGDLHGNPQAMFNARFEASQVLQCIL